VKTGVAVKEIVKANGKLRVTFEYDGEVQTLEADRVVNGAGRISNVDTLNLEAGNVKHDGLAIALDEYLRSTSNPAVWACGDSLVISAQLSPIAAYEGQIVGKNIVNGPKVKPDNSVMPSCVYTVHAEIHQLLHDTSEAAPACAEHVASRTKILQIAMASLYTATMLLSGAGLLGALADWRFAFIGKFAWLFTALAVLFVFLASVALIRESFISLRVISEHAKQVKTGLNPFPSEIH
jgi:pyruvate/2-oxoglutarate dehydrogenase complex dihydrolipoamide dehydrogenase (E3) component